MSRHEGSPSAQDARGFVGPAMQRTAWTGAAAWRLKSVAPWPTGGLAATLPAPLGALGATTAFLSLGSNYATVAAACSSTGCLAAWPSSTSVLASRKKGTFMTRCDRAI